MYCPYCASTLIADEDGRTLRCVAGGMALARDLLVRLRATFGGLPIGAPRVAPAAHGHLWYCPRCGDGLDKALTCTTCGRSLQPFLFELIEIHRHQPVPL